MPLSPNVRSLRASLVLTFYAFLFSQTLSSEWPSRVFYRSSHSSQSISFREVTINPSKIRSIGPPFSRYDFDARRAYIRLNKRVIVKQRGMRWHLSLIMDGIEPSERGRHVPGVKKKSEKETRKPRCAKPSTPKSRRRRMKPILDRTKSKAEAYTRRAALDPVMASTHYLGS